MDHDSTLSRLVKLISEATDADRVILFGSQAHGDAKSGSDYDFLIIKEDMKNERSISNLTYRALLDEGESAEVDILVADTKRLKESSWGILPEIRNYGIEVYVRG
ncbi:MAG: nucleotidyltransferase domain-containing protein [Spirochaetes bacterium]|nr:nucleotidyltransferase domain-containing protein [Spirochaetota bacterium]